MTPETADEVTDDGEIDDRTEYEKLVEIGNELLNPDAEILDTDFELPELTDIVSEWTDSFDKSGQTDDDADSNLLEDLVLEIWGLGLEEQGLGKENLGRTREISGE